MNPKFNLNNIGNIEGSNALKPDVENVVSPKINELEDNVIPFPSDKKNDNKIDEIVQGIPQDKESGNNAKVDLTGKQISEDGQVEDSATKKTLKAVGRGAAAYFSGGQSLKYDQQITNNRASDKLIGVVSDGLDKVPGVNAVTEGLDELNIADTANALMDTAGNAMNGDVAGAVESGAKTVKEAKKTVKKTEKALISKILMIATPVLIFFVILVVVLSPELGGFVNLTDNGSTNSSSSSGTSSSSYVKPGPASNGSYVSPSAVSNMNIQITEAQIEYLKTNIPSWSSLNNFQKNAIMAAYSAIGVVDYVWGSKPSSAGLGGINGGLDCSGFVSWVIWTASGNAFNQSTDALASQLGSNGLTEIAKADLLPGDIVVMRRPNNTGHALLYAGNNQYIHLAGKGQKVKMSTYSFKPENTVYYARYTG